MNTLSIQIALKEAGFDPGPLDGISGRQTIAAIKQFQQSRFLGVDGIVGPLTAAKLFPPKPGMPPVKLTTAIPWMELLESYRLAGYDEVGEKDEIEEWANALGIKRFDATKTAWCGLGMGHVFGATLPEEILPNNVLGARNWGAFGVKCDPQVGACLPFWRGSKKGWHGHVGLYAAERKDAFKVLGCNQSDAVTYAWIAKNRLLEAGARWPKTAPFLATGKLIASDGSALSTNEA